MSFSVATKTRPVATRGWPYSWPSKVAEVHAGVAGEKELPDGSTPERRESWSNVVQSEAVTGGERRGRRPARPGLARAHAGQRRRPRHPDHPRHQEANRGNGEKQTGADLRGERHAHFYIRRRSLATADFGMRMVPGCSTNSSLRRVAARASSQLVPASRRGRKPMSWRGLPIAITARNRPARREQGHELALFQ